MANNQAIFRTLSLPTENAAKFVKEYYPQGGATNLDNHLYCVIGREDDPKGNDPATNAAYSVGSGIWPDDGVPPAPQDTGYYDRLVWSLAIAGKKITPQNISLMVPKKETTEWKTGHTFDVYSDSDPNLYTANNFYCINQFFEVFILVKKNAGATTSLTEPVFHSQITNPATTGNVKIDGAAGFVYFNDNKQSIIETAEGYTWKYLYTLPNFSAQDLVQKNWLPVNFGQTRWDNQTDVRFVQSQDSIDTHGAAYRILGARYVLIRCLLDAGLPGSNMLPADLEYRQLSLIKNPKRTGANERATFSVGIQPNSQIVAGGSNQFALNTGRVLYIENKSPVYRKSDQTEEFKTVISF